jgi:hypothetical protein
MPNLIVWDVKTVPDLQLFAEAHSLTSNSDNEIREAMGDEAGSPIYRSIVCFGRLIAHFESDRWIAILFTHGISRKRSICSM